MRIYQFHFYNPAGGVPALDFSDCADDGSAAQEAFAQLRRHGSCQGVDVYQEDRLVIRLERPEGEVFPARSSVHGAA